MALCSPVAHTVRSRRDHPTSKAAVIDVSYRSTIGFCPRPGCGQHIDVSVGRYPGGVNDRGGFVIECASCHQKLHVRVSNPNDASSVESGGRVVDRWDDEIGGDRESVLAAHGLSEADQLSDTMLYIPSREPNDPLFERSDRSIYSCTICGGDLEAPAYAELDKSLSAVNQSITSFIGGPYLKGYTPVPAAIEVTLSVSCGCTARPVSFFRDFSERDHFVRSASDFILAGPEDPSMLSDIDGIYTRNECLAIFKKLLLRWRARNRVVMLVVPFIGFDYPSREEDKLKLWNMVLGYTDPARTLLVTRRRTYNSFKEVAAKQGLDLNVLKKYGLLARLLETLDEKKALFKTDSHAKFYAAVGPETTEVLSGSFNIHSGEYVENLLFKTYSSTEFIARYLMPLGVLFDLTQVKSPRALLRLEVSGSQVVRTSCETV